MRESFVNKLIELANRDKNLVFLTPDLGFSLLEAFRDKFPDRFFNTGIAEQNTIGMSAGLALNGKIVFVYSIVPFVTMRPFEQIRDDICYHNLSVKIVGSGGGFSYGPLGATHHAIEDVGIMRLLPNMRVFAPADYIEASLCTEAAYTAKGPAYLRLDRTKNEKSIHKEIPNFQIGKAIPIKESNDCMIIGCGSIMYEVIEANKILEKEGIECGIASMPTLNPIDEEFIIEMAENKVKIVTIEEHSIRGGLGTIVEDICAERCLTPILLKIGIPNQFSKEVGSQKYLRKIYGLDALNIAMRIKKFLDRKTCEICK